MKHLTRTTVLSARVLSVLVHSTACIQLDPFCSSDMFHATRQRANPRGFAHKWFGSVLLTLSRIAQRLRVLVRLCCCGGSGSLPTLLVLGSSHVQLSSASATCTGSHQGPFCSCPWRLRGCREGALSSSACPCGTALGVQNSDQTHRFIRRYTKPSPLPRWSTRTWSGQALFFGHRLSLALVAAPVC